MENNSLIDAGQFPGKNGGERIQAAIDSLGTKPKVIEVGPEGPDLDGCWLLTQAIIIPSNTTLVFHGSRLVMADSVSDNMIRNFHAETGDSRRDENIHILGLGGAELDGNAVNQVRQAQVDLAARAVLRRGRGGLKERGHQVHVISRCGERCLSSRNRSTRRPGA